MHHATRKLLYVLLSWIAVVQHSHAAPVSDAASPAFYSTPTPSELSDVNTLMSTHPFIPPGSLFTGLRAAPAVLVNVGLDAMAPAQSNEAQHMEVGTLPMPTLSHSCSPSTPVTIAISESTYVLTGRTFPAYAGFGVGTFILDSRDLSVAAPIIAALNSVAGPLDLGVPTTAPATSFATTFAELPFFNTAVTGFEVAESVMVASAWEVAQASFAVTQLPVISYEYDNAGCSAVAPPLPPASGTQPVPALNALHLLLLGAVVLFVAGISLRRRENVG